MDFKLEKEAPIKPEKFERYFNDLKEDSYLGGPKYRSRRIGFFKIKDDKLITLPNRGFLQKNKNRLAGNKKRYFKYLDPKLIAGQEFKKLLLYFLEKTDYDVGDVEFEVHQVRITCSPETEGKPALEGIHKDGTKIGCIYFVKKYNFTGGITTLYKTKEGKPVFKGELKEGQMIIIDDEKLYHYTSPIRPKNPKNVCYRDVLLISANPKENLDETELKKEVGAFLKKYNHSRHLSKNRKNQKNLNFVRFYSEIGRALGVRKERLNKFEKLLILIVGYIHGWDDLIDESGISISSARKVVLSRENISIFNKLRFNKKFGVGFEKAFKLMVPPLTKKERGQFIKKLGPVTLKKLQKYSRSKIYKELSLVKELNFDLVDYIETGESDLDVVDKYFVEEKKSRSSKATKNKIDKMLVLGNCDFYLYNNVFFRLKEDKDAELLEKFLRKYVLIDLLLDHVVDLEDDLGFDAFNTLKWYYNSNHKDKISKGDFNRKLDEAKVYDLYFKLAKGYERSARGFANKLNNNKLKKLLLYYLDGSMDGLVLFKKLKYFRGLPIQKQETLKKLILKPHPWEVLSEKELSNL